MWLTAGFLRVCWVKSRYLDVFHVDQLTALIDDKPKSDVACQLANA